MDVSAIFHVPRREKFRCGSSPPRCAWPVDGYASSCWVLMGTMIRFFELVDEGSHP